MPLFKLHDNKIQDLPESEFAKEGKLEKHLRKWLKDRIEVVSPDTLLIAEEFSHWDESNRSIDLLGVHKSGELVVIELKRTANAGHAELQAIRYAAMVSSMTLGQAVETYENYLEKNKPEDKGSAKDDLIKFIVSDNEAAQEEQEDNSRAQEVFGNKVQVVLVSAGFSKELTTSVMWLNEQGLNVRCTRVIPYIVDGNTYLDFQDIIPLPETAEYQIRIREKKLGQQAARASSKDYRKFDVTVKGEPQRRLNKRQTMLSLVSGILNNGGSIERIKDAIGSEIWSKKYPLFAELKGRLEPSEARYRIEQDRKRGSREFQEAHRYFFDEVFYEDGQTYVLSNQWGSPRFDKAAAALLEAFSDFDIRYTESP